MGGAPPMMAPGYSFSPAPGGPAPPYGYAGGMPPPGYPMASQAPGYNAAPGGFPAAPGAPMMGQPPYGMPPQPRPPMGPPRGGVLQPAEGRTVAVTHVRAGIAHEASSGLTRRRRSCRRTWRGRT